MDSRKPFTGTHRTLLLAFDVGTTYSGISYSILDPGFVPEIKGVNRFPAQEQVGGDSKIPSILYYDEDGVVQAAGAEALEEAVLEVADDEGWIKSEWFKLHLRPKSTASAHVTKAIPALPPNKTAVDVFADFLKYLFQCARTYIEQTHPNGVDFWSSIENHIEFILTHPNGWEGAQQMQMRQAAVMAGLISEDADGQSRLRFVTEGEASLHFCIQNGLNAETTKDGEGVLIVDAGGGTIDVSAYAATESAVGRSFEEISPPECHFSGSVFVSDRAREFLQVKLRDSSYAHAIGHIADCFDRTTKHRFRNSEEPAFIKFGTPSDKDPEHDILRGQLKLAGRVVAGDVAGFFEPSVTSIIESISTQRSTSQRPISTVLLVGGFAASDWLFLKIQSHLEPLGINFYRPDGHVNKAVADGAISFHIDHFVSARVAKLTYGTECNTAFLDSDPEHAKRSAAAFTSVSGRRLLPNHFDIILPKGVQVSETKEFRRSYVRDGRNPSRFARLQEDITCYRGVDQCPTWLDLTPEMFSMLCTITADTSALCASLKPQPDRIGDGEPYYRINYDIILSFGLTELKAQVCWMEDGEEKRSPAEIVYDQDVRP